MALSIVATSKMARGTDLAPKSGLTGLAMKASGSSTKLMVRASFGMLMATSTTAIGRTTKQTGTEPMYTSTEQSMKVTGAMTSKKDMAWSPGLMALATKEVTRRE